MAIPRAPALPEVVRQPSPPVDDEKSLATAVVSKKYIDELPSHGSRSNACARRERRPSLRKVVRGTCTRTRRGQPQGAHRGQPRLARETCVERLRPRIPLETTGQAGWQKNSSSSQHWARRRPRWRRPSAPRASWCGTGPRTRRGTPFRTTPARRNAATCADPYFIGRKAQTTRARTVRSSGSARTRTTTRAGKRSPSASRRREKPRGKLGQPPKRRRDVWEHGRFHAAYISGAVSAATRTFPRRRVAVPPRLRRGHFRGDESRWRRGCDADIPWRRCRRDCGADISAETVPPRLRRGHSVETVPPRLRRGHSVTLGSRA